MSAFDAHFRHCFGEEADSEEMHRFFSLENVP